jgi:hypothetical protein
MDSENSMMPIDTEDGMIRALKAVSTTEAKRIVALYIAGLPARKVREHIKKKTFSGARAIDHMRNPNTPKARTAWSTGEIVCREAELPIRRQHWNDRKDDDLTGIQQIDTPRKTLTMRNSYIPTIQDFESAYRLLTRPGQKISLDTILDQIAISIRKTGNILKENWRNITEENIKKWTKESGSEKK